MIKERKIKYVILNQNRRQTQKAKNKEETKTKKGNQKQLINFAEKLPFTVKIY